MAGIDKEKRIIATMIGLYCRKKHRGHDGVCDDCAALLDYSHKRLDHCPYQPDKPSCRKCETHCYRPDLRERMKAVMRFSGPRVLFYHPVEWVRHRFG